jgi:3-oxoacyl-[acyl-carrier-protein] synthase III
MRREPGQPAHAHVAGVGSFLPGDPISNDDLLRLVGPLPDDVLEGLQVKTRHWAVDPGTGEHRFANSEMAASAARQALGHAGLEPADIGLIVSATASPEYLLPPMATLLQERLGIASCAAIDIRSGCAGFVEALDLARLYLERGEHRTALVVGSETISPLLVPVFRGRDPERIRMRERIKPSDPGEGSAYRYAHTLPINLEEALNKFYYTKSFKEVLGERFAEAYQDVKNEEMQQYRKVISSWEREFLLLNV